MPKINWSALQSLFLDDCHSHVLFLLDCCFAASSVLSTDGASTVEAIVASGFESVAPLREKDSFTTFLTAALKESRNEEQPVFVGRLCSRISAKLNRTERISEREGGRRVTPFHIDFANTPERIVIGTLPDGAETPASTEEKHQLATPLRTVLEEAPESQYQPNPEKAKLHTNTLPDLSAKHHAKPTSDPPIKANAPSTSIFPSRLVQHASQHTSQHVAQAASRLNRGGEVRITQEVVTAVAGNQECGREIIAILLEQRGDEFKITQEVVTAAAGNQGCGRAIIAILLEQRGDEFKITQEVVTAAAGNQGCGRAIIAILLEQRGDEFKITQEVVTAAAGNQGCGRAIMAILLKGGLRFRKNRVSLCR
ncbi:uncharacterized protein B0I36DRAFT_56897 [Microdochium trichocladiopsis]|uniref:Uncharacterized protein n=1 Tax=Microdochium trichocladiopsis TaxID=1682393 RepID=A0A9P8XQA6_9PEZI|nr:uncharacterized protein B0I36DRAFT_56897 [Microdochium trichocladiopsis]KAH7010882.1 hypothetical protein B0I36DRAFT_56897 [Microdochium trichocladiopsis]